MTSIAKQHIFFVDDNPEVRNAVGRTLKQVGAKVSCFACAADCLEKLRNQRCDLLITDVKMPGMSGIGLLREVKKLAPWLPVLVITGYADISMAIEAMRAGALDFIQKPLDRESFLSVVRSVLKRNAMADRLLGKPLTKTETIVLRLIMDGKTSREISDLLNVTIRAIEFHRRNIYKKFDVHNVVDLVKLVKDMGLF
ncbi:MAG: response regulator transcription factor [Planctomycetota bacterium]|jgi:two-component system response regulator TtrR